MPIGTIRALKQKRTIWKIIWQKISEGKTFNYIRLLPLDYFEQKPDKSEEKGETNNTLWINYKTNNPNVFWEH
jgi:hypothetical protein